MIFAKFKKQAFKSVFLESGASSYSSLIIILKTGCFISLNISIQQFL